MSLGRFWLTLRFESNCNKELAVAFCCRPRALLYVGGFHCDHLMSLEAIAIARVALSFFFTENGKLYAQIHIGLTEKTIVVGEALGDDLWHSVKLERRGMVLSLGIDDDRPIIGMIISSTFACLISVTQFTNWIQINLIIFLFFFSLCHWIKKNSQRTFSKKLD